MSDRPQRHRAPLLSLRGMNKSFGAVQVLHDVDLDVYGRPGHRAGRRQRRRQVHPDQVHRRHPRLRRRRVPLRGQARHVHGPKDATALGIEVVYQDLALCDNLDIVQNMFLGREEHSGSGSTRSPWRSWRRETLAGAVRAHPQVGAPAVASLSGGQRQTVAIAKAVLWNSKVVILDEPTAALGVAQTEQVLTWCAGSPTTASASSSSPQHERRLRGRRPHRRAVPRADGRPGRRAEDVTTRQVVELITAGPVAASSACGRARPDGGRQHDDQASLPSAPSEAVERRPAGDRSARSGRLPGAGARRRHWARCPPSSALVVLVIVLHDPAGPGLPDQRQLRQPAHPERADHRHRDGPRLRPAARRDRPVRRLHRRPRRPSSACSSTKHGLPWYVAIAGALLTGVVIGLLIGAAGGAARHPVVRRHAGGVPRPAGRAAARSSARAARSRPTTGHRRDHEQEHAAVCWAGCSSSSSSAGSRPSSLRRRAHGAGRRPPVVSAAVIWFKIGALAVLLGVATFVLNLERGSLSSSSASSGGGTSIKGVPDRRPDRHRLRRRSDVRAEPHLLRPARLRRRRQRRGGAPRRHQRAAISARPASSSARRWRPSPASCSPRATNSVSPGPVARTTLLLRRRRRRSSAAPASSVAGPGHRRRPGWLVVAVIGNGLPLITEQAGGAVHRHRPGPAAGASVDALARRRAAATGR